MSYFAKVQDGKVISMITAEQDFLNNYNDGLSGEWIQCSYNVIGGVYYLQDGTIAEPQSDYINDAHPSRKRKNYPSVGWNYSSEYDAFYDIQPHSSWILNESTFQWEAPVAYPEDGERYRWDEATTSWVAVE